MFAAVVGVLFIIGFVKCLPAKIQRIVWMIFLSALIVSLPAVSLPTLGAYMLFRLLRK